MLGSRKDHDFTISGEDGLPAVSVTITAIGVENEELAAEISRDLKARYEPDQEGDDV